MVELQIQVPRIASSNPTASHNLLVDLCWMSAAKNAKVIFAQNEVMFLQQGLSGPGEMIDIFLQFDTIVGSLTDTSTMCLRREGFINR